MAFDTFLQIDGIPGESLDENHTDWIELKSFNFGASQSTSATASSSGGASAERVNLSEFSIQKYVDKASPKIFESCCKGQHISSVVLHVNRAGGDKLLYLAIELEEVIISSSEMEGISASTSSNQDNSEDSHDLPYENVKFNYGKIKVTYTQQKRSDGTGGGNVAGGWDRTRNKVYS